jgi:hypothetical protein
MAMLTERYSEKINGVLSCYDRVLLQGTLPGLCYADGMTKYLHDHNVRIFDYPKFAEPLRDQIRENAERLAVQHGLKIEFVRSHGTHKEAIIEKVLKERGDHPGLVHSLGDGDVPDLQTLARQTDSPDISQTGSKQVPALLFLLH